MRTPQPCHVDIVIASRAGAAVADYTQPLGRATLTAHAWQDSLHIRAQIRAERHLRSTDNRTD